MADKILCLSQGERVVYVVLDKVVSIAQGPKGGAYVYVVGDETIAVDEAPAKIVAAILLNQASEDGDEH